MSDGIVSEEEQITRTENIDWRALFEEFGLHIPDAVGDLAASKTRVHLALEVSDQQIAGEPASHVRTAVENGTLIEETVQSHEGTTVTQGYRLGVDLA